MSKAIKHLDRRNFRLHRANSMTAWIMHEMHDLLPQDKMPQIHNKLIELLAGGGIDFITDEDRRSAGLEPRDEYGTTPTELFLMEQQMIQLLYQKINPPFLPDE